MEAGVTVAVTATWCSPSLPMSATTICNRRFLACGSTDTGPSIPTAVGSMLTSTTLTSWTGDSAALDRSDATKVASIGWVHDSWSAAHCDGGSAVAPGVGGSAATKRL